MTKPKLFLISLVVLVVVAGFASAGTKEEVIRLQSDVLQLQKQILMMQKTFDENNATIKSLLEQLIDQSAGTQRVFEQLVAVAKDQKTDARKGFQDLGKEIQDLSVKLDDTNNRLAALHQKVEENQAKVETRRLPSMAEPGGPKPDQVYSLAFNDYLAGNYELAIAGLRDFLINYPESEYADNAAYYLGLCHQIQGRPEPAIQAFDEVINLYPKADMTPSAYYKKAQVEQELQRNEEAIETLKKLVTLFPDSQEAVNARLDLERMGVDVAKLTRRR